MPTLDEGRRLILERAGTLGTETVELADSLGLVTAKDTASPWDMPLSSNSAMDGFAVPLAAAARRDSVLIFVRLPKRPQ